MDTHVRVLGMLSIGFGAVTGAMALFLLLYFGSPEALFHWGDMSGGIGIVIVFATLYHLILAIPMVVAGIAVLRFSEAGRRALIVLSALNIINFPLGSVLSGYALWVLLLPETEPLFTDPIWKRATASPAPKPDRPDRPLLSVPPKPARPDLRK